MKKKKRKRKNQEVDKMIEILWNWKCVENLYRLNIIGGKDGRLRKIRLAPLIGKGKIFASIFLTSILFFLYRPIEEKNTSHFIKIPVKGTQLNPPSFFDSDFNVL